MVSERARLDRREAQLFARFTVMERMLSSMNAQAGWMAQQMGGMGM
jgi:flagellar capping protein FliD